MSRRRRRVVGFYTDEEKRVRPITAPVKPLILRRPITYQLSKGRTMSSLRALHELGRSLHAQRIDEALEATVKDDPSRWVKAPNRSDITGIDYFPIPLSSVKYITPRNLPPLTQREALQLWVMQKFYSQHLGWKLNLKRDIDPNVRRIIKSLARKGYVEIKENGDIIIKKKIKKFDNYRFNVMMFTKGYEDHFNVDLGDLKFRRTQAKGWRAYAYYRPSKHTIYFSKPVHRVLSSGEVKTLHDFYALHTLAHELGHAIRGKRGTQGKFKRYIGYEGSVKWIDEGSNDISALRFVLHHVQIDPKLRREILHNPEKLLKGLGYRKYIVGVADLSLLVNNGDEKKAIMWIEKLRGEPDHKKFIMESIKKNPSLKGVDWDDITRSWDFRQALKSRGITPTEERTGDDRYWYIVKY